MRAAPRSSSTPRQLSGRGPSGPPAFLVETFASRLQRFAMILTHANLRFMNACVAVPSACSVPSIRNGSTTLQTARGVSPLALCVWVAERHEASKERFGCALRSLVCGSMLVVILIDGDRRAKEEESRSKKMDRMARAARR
jgi:hypothetical protein